MKRNVSLNSFFIAIALLLILLIFVGEAIRSNNTLSLQTFEKGRALPVFSVPELYHPEKFLTENDLKGQVCLLNFWASWCIACHKEHNTLMVANKKYHIPVFGITFKDSSEKAKQWLEKTGNPYAVVGSDPTGKVALEFEVFGIPITYIVDKQGVARYRYLGTLTLSSWEQEILPIIRKLESE